MARRAAATGCVLVLALLVYLAGPRALAPQSERASRACERVAPARTTQWVIEWQVIPVAGWRCVFQPSGEVAYVGWWAS